MNDLSQPEKILIAAAELEAPFTAEELAVAAWKKYPDTFGLRGFTDQHPNCNRINTSLMGKRGMVERGLLIKDGDHYLINKAERPAKPPKKTRSSVRDMAVERMMGSAALKQFSDSPTVTIMFANACQFWGITETTPRKRVAAKLQETKKIIAELDTLSSGKYLRLPSGRIITPGDIRLLGNLHRWMEEKFSRHLAVLGSKVNS